MANQHAGCLECNAKVLPAVVKKATEEIASNRCLLQMYLKMVLASPASGTSLAELQHAIDTEHGLNNNGANQVAQASLKQNTLSVVYPVENILRTLAFHGNTSFTTSLQDLAKV